MEERRRQASLRIFYSVGLCIQQWKPPKVDSQGLFPYSFGIR